MLGDRAPDGQCVSEIGVELGVAGVGLDAESVEDLAEEAARSGGEDDIEDVRVGQAKRARLVGVGLRDGGCVEGDLVGERDDRDVDGGEFSRVEVGEDGSAVAGAEELVQED